MNRREFIKLGGGAAAAALLFSKFPLVFPKKVDKLTGINYIIKSKGAPVGLIQAYVGTSVPDGWVLCDGRALVPQEHYELYQIIGTTYGTKGFGFKVPDLRGKFG